MLLPKGHLHSHEIIRNLTYLYWNNIMNLQELQSQTISIKSPKDFPKKSTPIMRKLLESKVNVEMSHQVGYTFFH